MTSEHKFSDVGYCPICESAQRFVSLSEWYRDNLLCLGCGSIPRERALAHVLTRSVPDWRAKRIHECSPAPRSISEKARRECQGYIATQYFTGEPLGAIVRGFRNENLENTTFEDGSFDVILSLDVLEHVNEPADCFVDMHRTLAPGGLCIFTVPTEKGMVDSERLARFLPDGAEELYASPEYHGNPISEKGALVTFRYGYDFAVDITQYAPFDVTVYRFANHTLGILGDYTEVYECRKRNSPR